MSNILSSDSYKFSHYLQFPPGSEFINSYIEPRGVAKDFPQTNEIVNAGLQGYIKKYLNRKMTQPDIVAAEHYATLHGVPFNREGWEYIVTKYGGYLPLHIQALPEGTVFPLSTCQVQVVNTDPKVPWLTSYIETALLRAIWYPSTVATLSREIKKVFKRYLDETSDNPEVIDFMLHDFGARGCSSQETAEIGGAAHLLNFKGSDTMEAISYINDYMRAPSTPFEMPAYSIPASEHATLTSWLSCGGEEAAFENMIDQFGGDGKIYACVSDSYDIYHAVNVLWGQKLKQKILDKGGRLVVRPDSGDPKTVILDILYNLAKNFGTETNSKGYFVLHPSVRVIQGDGVDYHSIQEILEEMKRNNFSAENIVFGVGGALLQKVNRDSLKYAMKASAIQINGEWHDVYKDPVTDKGKRSKRGRLAVNYAFETVRAENSPSNMLKTYYKLDEYDTYILGEDFKTMRNRASL